MQAFPDLSGRRIGPYDVKAFIAAGGMAAVYRAIDTRSGYDVALKVLPGNMAEEDTYFARFEREARAASRLQHPHIVRTIDYDIVGDISYVAMQLLVGGTLTQRFRHRQNLKNATSLPSLEEIAYLLECIGSALDYAHSEKVIHRDIKPSNIMFDGNGVPYLVDFGIAKVTTATSVPITQTGIPIGTPVYMAPEQWRGAKTDSKIDQYALAIAIYRLLTGDVPFRANTPFELMDMHETAEVPPITNRPPDVAQALYPIVRRALAKKASDRYHTLAHFSVAFRNMANEFHEPPNGYFTFPLPRPSWAAEPAPTPAIPTLQTKSSRRGRTLMVVGALILALLLCIGIVAVLGSGGDTERDSDNATQEPLANNIATETATLIEIIATDARLPTASPTVTVTVSATPIEDDINTPTDTLVATKTPLPTTPVASSAPPTALVYSFVTPNPFAYQTGGIFIQYGPQMPIVLKNTAGRELELNDLWIRFGSQPSVPIVDYVFDDELFMPPDSCVIFRMEGWALPNSSVCFGVQLREFDWTGDETLANELRTWSTNSVMYVGEVGNDTPMVTCRGDQNWCFLFWPPQERFPFTN